MHVPAVFLKRDGAPRTCGLRRAQVKLKYKIHACSSWSARYAPTNILYDNCTDQTSRWSSGSNLDQFIMLELESPAILCRITFGKFEKPHPCNLKEFKVYGGLKPENMIELLESGLRNDTESETFRVLNETSGVLFPVKYVKIVPLLAHGSRAGDFNYSIWHVALNGIVDPGQVEAARTNFEALKEREAVRLCLKHFRQRNYVDSFQQLQKRTKIELESPELTVLYDSLVVKGDYATAERTMQECADTGLLEEYISSLKYKAVWSLLGRADAAGDNPFPGPRGGHQMCIDRSERKIYLFGGWHGTADLGDFWRYDLDSSTWTLLSPQADLDGGPAPRSCHKMCINSTLGHIYALGRYVDRKTTGSCSGA